MLQVTAGKNNTISDERPFLAPPFLKIIKNLPEPGVAFAANTSIFAQLPET